jgi:hypothetical protein
MAVVSFSGWQHLLCFLRILREKFGYGGQTPVLVREQYRLRSASQQFRTARQTKWAIDVLILKKLLRRVDRGGGESAIRAKRCHECTYHR